MSMEIQLELGHRSAMREKPTAKGFTHDWTAFVRGAEGSNISSIVDKVVFYLHESFPKPRRVVKESPYQLSESGYAGFTMVIEVFFKSKEEPKKVEFYYDLFLKMSTSPANSIRREKLTFQNPSEDFRLKLLTAGGIDCVPEGASGTSFLQTQTSAPVQPVAEPSRPVSVHAKSTLVAEKKIKSRSTAKEASHSSHSKPKKILPPPPPNKPVSGKEPKSVSKASHSPESKESKSKAVKSEKEPKSASKRPTPDGQNHHGPSEKKKRHHSSSDSNEKHTDNKTKETKEKKEKHKNKLSGHGSKKEKHKLSHGHTTNKDHIKSPSKPTSRLRSVSPNEDSNDAKPPTVHEDDNASSPTSDLMDATETWCEASSEKMDVSSGKESISPLSPEIQHSPPVITEKLRRNSNHDTEDVFEDKKPSLKAEKSPKPKNSSKSKKSSVQTNNHSNNSNHGSTKQNGSLKDTSQVSPTANKTVTKYGKESPDRAYFHELVDLQKMIISLEDRNIIQKVVDIIEETGQYRVTSKSFDFDLLRLDQNTVRKLKQYLLSNL